MNQCCYPPGFCTLMFGSCHWLKWSWFYFHCILTFSSFSDSVVLESFAVFWPGRQSQIPPVRHRHIQGSPPRVFCPGRHERHPEVSDPQRRSLHWPLTIRSYLVWTFGSYLRDINNTVVRVKCDLLFSPSTALTSWTSQLMKAMRS